MDGKAEQHERARGTILEWNKEGGGESCCCPDTSLLYSMSALMITCSFLTSGDPEPSVVILITPAGIGALSEYTHGEQAALQLAVKTNASAASSKHRALAMLVCCQVYDCQISLNGLRICNDIAGRFTRSFSSLTGWNAVATVTHSIQWCPFVVLTLTVTHSWGKGRYQLQSWFNDRTACPLAAANSFLSNFY